MPEHIVPMLARMSTLPANEDDWGFENVLAQITWATTLGHEGGLFVVIGQKRIKA